MGKKGKELGWNTKIDGIGSQMHISYYENPQILESKKKAIQNMLKIMVESKSSSVSQRSIWAM